MQVKPFDVVDIVELPVQLQWSQPPPKDVTEEPAAEAAAATSDAPAPETAAAVKAAQEAVDLGNCYDADAPEATNSLDVVSRYEPLVKVMEAAVSFRRAVGKGAEPLTVTARYADAAAATGLLSAFDQAHALPLGEYAVGCADSSEAASVQRLKLVTGYDNNGVFKPPKAFVLDDKGKEAKVGKGVPALLVTATAPADGAVSAMARLGSQALLDMQAAEQAMDAHDTLVNETQAMRNDLEAYVYEMRDKVIASR